MLSVWGVRGMPTITFNLTEFMPIELSEIIKWGIVAVLAFFALLAFLVGRQVFLLDRFFKTLLGPILRLVAFLYFCFVLWILYLAIITL